jgi:integrase
MDLEAVVAGRPKLEIGTYGEISTHAVREGLIAAECRYRDADGVTRRISASGDTAAKAKAALRRKIKERNTASSQPISSGSAFARLIDGWLEALPQRITRTGRPLAPATLEAYTDIAEKILKPEVGSLTLRELTTQRVDTYLAGRATQQHQVRVVLNQVCSLGVRWGLMQFNPVRETEAPRKPQSDKRTLTPADVQELFARIERWQGEWKGGPRRGYDHREIFAVLMGTGERIGEVLALRWEDVELPDDPDAPALVTIAGTITKSGERQPFPKSEHGFRRLKLPGYGKEALIRQRDHKLPFELVFPTRIGTPQLPSNVRANWRVIRGEEYEWVTPKTFRKTAATAIERRNGAEAAARQLGHGSSAVTKKHYIDRAVDAPDNTAALDEYNPFPANKRRTRPDKPE